jgi:hypothetical protein
MGKLLDDLELHYPDTAVLQVHYDDTRWALTTLQLAFRGSPNAVALFETHRAELYELAARKSAAVEGIPLDARAALAAWSYTKIATEAASEFVLDELPASIASRFGINPHGVEHFGLMKFQAGNHAALVAKHLTGALGCYGQLVNGELHLTVFLHFPPPKAPSAPPVTRSAGHR